MHLQLPGLPATLCAPLQPDLRSKQTLPTRRLRCRDVKTVNCAGEPLQPHVAFWCPRLPTTLLLREVFRQINDTPCRNGGGRFASALDRAGALPDAWLTKQTLKPVLMVPSPRHPSRAALISRPFRVCCLLDEVMLLLTCTSKTVSLSSEREWCTLEPHTIECSVGVPHCPMEAEGNGLCQWWCVRRPVARQLSMQWQSFLALVGLHIKGEQHLPQPGSRAKPPDARLHAGPMTVSVV